MATLAPRPLSLSLPRLRDLLAMHYRSLSAASRRLRFMGAVSPEVTDTIARRASPALVLAIEVDGADRAILEIFRTKDEGHAEIGLSVEDPYQRRGYGRSLFERGIIEARELGMQTVDVHFSENNMAIRKLCQEHGGCLITHGSEYISHIPL